VTTAPHWFGSFDLVWFGGQVIVQGLTATVKLHVAWLPEASVALQLTVVVPTLKSEPDAGMQEVVTPVQLSLAIGAKLTVLEPEPGELSFTFMFAGQVIDGFSVSLTVMVNEQLPATESEQVTVVVPWGKKEPLKGEQEIVPPQAGPVSVAAG
jgi:hypothetical protein